MSTAGQRSLFKSNKLLGHVYAGIISMLRGGGQRIRIPTKARGEQVRKCDCVPVRRAGSRRKTTSELARQQRRIQASPRTAQWTRAGCGMLDVTRF